METYDEIFNDAAKDLSKETIDVSQESQKAIFRNGSKFFVPEYSYDTVFALLKRGLSVMPSIEFMLGHNCAKNTDYKYPSDPKLNSIIEISYEIINDDHREINCNQNETSPLFLGYDFKPYTFGAYCRFFNFINYVSLLLRLKPEVLSDDRNSMFSHIISVQREFEIPLKHLSFSNYRDIFYYANTNETIEEFKSKLEKHFKNILTDNLKNHIEIELVRNFDKYFGKLHQDMFEDRGSEIKRIDAKMNGLIVRNFPDKLLSGRIFVKFDEYSITHPSKGETIDSISLYPSTKIIHSSILLTTNNLYIVFQPEESLSNSNLLCEWAVGRLPLKEKTSAMLKLKIILNSMFYDEAGSKIYNHIKKEIWDNC